MKTLARFILISITCWMISLPQASALNETREQEEKMSIQGELRQNDNPIFTWIVRRMIMSYVKRKTKKYIRNRVLRWGVNRSADRAVKYAVESVADDLSYSEQTHVRSHWENKEQDVAHAHDCAKCSQISERVLVRVGYSDWEKQGAVSYHKGTKFNFGLTFPEAMEENVNQLLETSDAFSGYNFSLEQNVGFIQFEGGYKYYDTTNENFDLDKYTLRNLFLSSSLTLPLIKFLSPYAGGGYMYSKVTIEQNGVKDNFNNSGPFYFAGIDIRISRSIYLNGEYTRTFNAEAYDFRILEGGIKVVFR